MLKIVLLLSACVAARCAATAKLEEVFAWNELTFAWPSEAAKAEALKSGDYIPANNLPLGLEIWKDKMFVTVPRWKAGVPAALNYVPLKPRNKTASLIPYPSLEANALPKGGETPAENSIVSPFRVKVDSCDRLWVMDIGLSDLMGNLTQVSTAYFLIYDLKTDKLVRRYNLKDSDLAAGGSFFPNIIVDIIDGQCDKAFAYIPDLSGYGLVVYSFEANDSWRARHHFFYFDPLRGDLTVGGINFQWTDGVFGVALGPQATSGYRTLYFHALASYNEFSVSTAVLRNKTLALDSNNYHLYKHEGNKGPNSQSTASGYDEKTGVLFLPQLLKDGVACWNTKKTLKPENVALFAQDHEGLIFPNDLKVDQERNVWVVSDKLPTFMFSQLDSKEVNYRVFKIPVDEAIKGTVCAP